MNWLSNRTASGVTLNSFTLFSVELPVTTTIPGSWKKRERESERERKGNNVMLSVTKEDMTNHRIFKLTVPSSL